MSHPRKKLDREHKHEIQAKWGDSLRLFEYQDSVWLILADQAGDDILRIYQVHDQQLASLHAQIGQRLGLAPAATMEHLRTLHLHLDQILSREEAERRAKEEQAFREQFGLPAEEPETP